MGPPTSVGNALEILKDGFDLRSLPRSLAPAFFGNLPDRPGHPWGFKAARLRWSFALKNLNGDFWISPPWEGDLSGRELETKTIRTWTGRTFGKRACLHDDHRQRIHVRPVRWFFLLIAYDASGVEKLGGTVPDREAAVGGRSVN